MAILTRQSGVWKDSKPMVKDGGVWKEVKEGYVRDAGVWKQMYSSGPSWVVYSVGSADFIDVAYGAGKIIAISQFAQYASTDNGATWSSTNSGIPSGEYRRAIAYGNGVWAITTNTSSYPSSGTGKIYTSADGVTWTLRHSLASAGYEDIAYAGGRWVAVGGHEGMRTYGAHIATSTNNTTWSGVYYAQDTDEDLGRVAYGGGRWVALGNYSYRNHHVTSTDGTTWTRFSGTNFTGRDSGIAYGAGVWVATPQANRYLSSSTDGLTWTQRSSAQDHRDVAFNTNTFMALRETQGVRTSVDGIVWGDTEAITGMTSYNRVTGTSQGNWVVVGNGGYIAIGQYTS